LLVPPTLGSPVASAAVQHPPQPPLPPLELRTLFSIHIWTPSTPPLTKASGGDPRPTIRKQIQDLKLETKDPRIVHLPVIPDKPSRSVYGITPTDRSAMRALDEYLELHDTKEELEHEMAVIENSIKEVNDSYGKQRRDLAYYVDKDLPKKYRAEHQTVAVRQLDEVK
jgi:chemotaxis regulatin CheY-phosphate phosphatase CheZ